MPEDDHRTVHPAIAEAPRGGVRAMPSSQSSTRSLSDRPAATDAHRPTSARPGPPPAILPGGDAVRTYPSPRRGRLATRARDGPPMDLLADLTPAQREAVTHVDGPLLVLAGAGSGKTRVITRRVAHLLGRGIAGRNILALTFTNKAAGEMRERIAALVPGSGVWVGTFHALCARLLREHGPRIGLDRGFTIYDQADRLRADQVGDGAARPRRRRRRPREGRGRHQPGQERHGRPRAYLARRGDGADHVSAVVGRVFKAYQERLLESSAVDFDDLLVHVVTLLREDRELRARLDARFRYVLVDEYQDTNLAQYAIVRALSVDQPNLCVTGDPDQSIYGWRGANLNNILEFEHDYPGCKVVRLERNYRSTKNILRVADHLIRHNRRRKPKGLTTENPEGDPVELATFGTETDEAQAVAVDDRRPRPRRRLRLRRRRRLRPGHGPDPRARVGPPVAVDPLPGRRRRLVLRAAGGQGRPGLPEPPDQPEGRHRLPPGGQRPAPGARQGQPRTLAGASPATAASRCWPPPARRCRPRPDRQGPRRAPRLRPADGRADRPAATTRPRR